MELPISKTGENAWDVAVNVARSAGEVLLSWWTREKEVFGKGKYDIVTNVDQEAESHIRHEIQHYYPSHGFFGEEEAGADPEKGWVWIVDPVDGTRNYAAGVPHFSIVIALAKDGEVVTGVNYDPLHDEMFHAAAGRGAYLNEERIKVSERTSLQGASVGLDPSNGDPEGTVNTLQVIRKLWPNLMTTRMMGSSALGISYVACGRSDIYINHRLQPYDQAAGLILVEEAGGVITDRQGFRAGLYSDGVIACSSPMFEEFLEVTKNLPWRRLSGRSINPREQ